MKFSFKAQTPRLLLATVLAVSAAASFAATGYTVSTDQEIEVKRGMTIAQVLQAIGQPFNTVNFRNQDGSTWQYHVSGDSLNNKTFYVDFDAKGMVASTSEISIPFGADAAAN